MCCGSAVRPLISAGSQELTSARACSSRTMAEGNSNGQIATALFISPKTASVHVSNILTKLGVASRTEAATLAHCLGLIPLG